MTCRRADPDAAPRLSGRSTKASAAQGDAGTQIRTASDCRQRFPIPVSVLTGFPRRRQDDAAQPAAQGSRRWPTRPSSSTSSAMSRSTICWSSNRPTGSSSSPTAASAARCAANWSTRWPTWSIACRPGRIAPLQPRRHRDHRPCRSGAGAAVDHGASGAGPGLPAGRRGHAGRRGQRRGDARRHVEAVKQVAVADRIVVTKADLVDDADALAALRARLRRHQSGRGDPRRATTEAASVAALFDCGLYDPDDQDAPTCAAGWARRPAHAP